MALSLNGVSVTSADGSSRDLATDNGSVLLIVNVASQCGFTKQYAGLQQLHERYGKQGLKVIGFPCNDFGAQEPGTIEEIKTFCSSNYGVSFELMSKVASDAAPFDTLTQADPAGPIAWNFEKFLVGRDGTVIARFKSGVAPEDLKSAVEVALAA